MSFPARALLFTVRVYQAFFSGLMPSACKFYPSCSHYAAEAIRIHGARRGAWLALRRLSRCHPFGPGGVDLVPEAANIPRERTIEPGFSFGADSHTFCHSERSEESLSGFHAKKQREIPRSARNDRSVGNAKKGESRVKDFFRKMVAQPESLADRSENQQAEACATKEVPS